MEEKEISKAVDSSQIKAAMAKLAETEAAAQEARRAHEKQLAAVKISAADVELIAVEYELDKKKAERALREAGGDVKKALTALLATPGLTTQA